jgi:hypothetical protein
MTTDHRIMPLRADGTVGHGLSRSLADRPASLPGWIAARSGHGRASLIRKRSFGDVDEPVASFWPHNTE